MRVKPGRRATGIHIAAIRRSGAKLYYACSPLPVAALASLPRAPPSIWMRRERSVCSVFGKVPLRTPFRTELGLGRVDRPRQPQCALKGSIRAFDEMVILFLVFPLEFLLPPDNEDVIFKANLHVVLADAWQLGTDFRLPLRRSHRFAASTCRLQRLPFGCWSAFDRAPE